MKYKYIKYSAILVVIFCTSPLLNAASYTTKSKTETIPAGTYGGNVDVGITDTYGLTNGIAANVNVDVQRTSAANATGIYFNSASGIGTIQSSSIKVKDTMQSAIVYGIRFQNASQTSGKLINSTVSVNSTFQARGAIYLYGTSSCGNMSGSFSATTSSTLSSAYASAIILNSTSTFGSFNKTTIIASGANAYGIASNRTITDNFNFTGGNTITASGSLASYILFSSRDMVLTGNTNTNVLSSNLSNAEVYAKNGMNFKTGVYKFTQATELSTDSSQVNLSNGAKIILSSENSKLTLSDSKMTINKGFEMDITLSRDFNAGESFYAVNGETIVLSGFNSENDATDAVKLKKSDGTDFAKLYTAKIDSYGLIVHVIPEASECAAIIGPITLCTSLLFRRAKSI